MSSLTASLNTENFILNINSFLDANLCGYLIEQGENYIANKEKSVFVDKSHQRQDTQLFSSEGFDPLVPNLNVPVGLLLSEMLEFSTSIYYTVIESGLNSLPYLESFKLQKTQLKTKGFSAWHVEQATNQAACRVFAWSIYLNDVEEGGETEFLYQGKRYKPKTGDFLMWPAGVTHLHRGNPPLSNTKYILTGWLCGSAGEENILEKTQRYKSILDGDSSTFKYYTCPDILELN